MNKDQKEKEKAKEKAKDPKVDVYDMNGKVGSFGWDQVKGIISGLTQNIMIELLRPLKKKIFFDKTTWLNCALEIPYFVEIGFAMADLNDYCQTAIEEGYIVKISDKVYQITQKGLSLLG